MEERDGPLRVVRMAYRGSAVRVAYLLGVLAVTRRLARQETRVDVLHAHVHRMGWPALLAGMVLRRPVVITEHSSEVAPPDADPGCASPRPGSRSAGPRSSARQRAPAARNRELRCPGAVPHRSQHRRHDVFHPPETPRTGPPRLINVARHVEIKGLDVLLRAFAAVASRRPDLTLDLIGDGPLTGDLQRTAAELDLSARVRFHGSANSGAGGRGAAAL